MGTMNNEARKNYDNNLVLLKKAQAGDSLALDQLVEINLPLVAALTKKFMNRGYEYDDIFQIGSMGLIKAIQNFDLSYDVKFSTYAVPMIMGEIRRFLRDDGFIKVSRNVKYLAKKIHYGKEKLTQSLKREPTIQELAEYMDISKEELVFSMDATLEPQYLYEIIHQEDGAPIYLMDKLTEEEDLSIADKMNLKDVLSTLDKRSRQIIMLRYFKDVTQMNVAKMLGISQVQVSRIEKKVLSQMKEKLKE
ncbi:RNA polymerase sporulation sigma factor SigF [Clostridium grantii]|uniref:RNA polymerase sigma factor n=1 Tax=Clostridium grantii DSM 8605 TaxID=1121316 RepID=A0A1M5SL64_9CLOT|nr:RNA polymerase sporulation sigma factor SigF [Clostridium grantii]SHH39302.1 RNA polymerase sporulation-specific sigma factor [Clostridium grantii DSM 8605]